MSLKRVNRRWSPEEDAFVTYWYSKVGIPASLLCMDLNRTEPSVTHRVYKLGLKQPPEGMAVGNRRRVRSSPDNQTLPENG